MRTRKRPEDSGDFVKTTRIPEACARYGLGEGTMRKVAEDANAIIRIGRVMLVNCSKIDKYMDGLSQ